MESTLDEEAASLFEGMDFMTPIMDDETPDGELHQKAEIGTKESQATALRIVEATVLPSSESSLPPVNENLNPSHSLETVPTGGPRLSEPLDENLFCSLSISSSTSDSINNVDSENNATSLNEQPTAADTLRSSSPFMKTIPRAVTSDSHTAEEPSALSRKIVPFSSQSTANSQELGSTASGFSGLKQSNIQRKKKRSLRIGYDRESDESNNHEELVLPAPVPNEQNLLNPNSKPEANHKSNSNSVKRISNYIESAPNRLERGDSTNHVEKSEKDFHQRASSKVESNGEVKHFSSPSEESSAFEKSENHSSDANHEKYEPHASSTIANNDHDEGDGGNVDEKGALGATPEADMVINVSTVGEGEEDGHSSEISDQKHAKNDVSKNKDDRHHHHSETNESDESAVGLRSCDEEKDARSAGGEYTQEAGVVEEGYDTEKDKGEEATNEGEENEGTSEPKDEVENQPSAEQGSVESSLEKKIVGIKKHLDSNLSEIRSKVMKLNEQRKGGVQRRREAKKKHAKLMQEIKEKEAALSEACEREDFESADSLSQEIESMECEAKKFDEDGKLAEQLCDSCSEILQDCETKEINIMHQASSSLKQVQQEASEMGKAVKTMAERKCLEEMERVAQEEEAVNAKKRKIKLEQRVVDEERKVLQEKIDECTKSERDEKDILLSQRGDLEAELSALMEKVRLKKEEIENMDDQISAIDSKIKSACSRFEKQQMELEQEEERIRDGLVQISQEEKRMEEERRAIETAVEHAIKEGDEYASVSAYAAGEIEEIERAIKGKSELSKLNADQRERKKHLCEKESAVSEQIATLQLRLGSVRSEIQEYSVQRMKLQQEVASLEQKITLSEKRLPELEAEKKLAASARNFKEAARMASEAKSLQSIKESAMTELAQRKEEVERIEKDEEGKATMAVDMEAQLKELEAEGAVCKYEILKLSGMEIRREIEIAVDAEDFEEAENLNFEVEVLEEEMKVLRETHAHWFGDEV